MEDYVDQRMQQAQGRDSSEAFAGATPMVDKSILGEMSDAHQ